MTLFFLKSDQAQFIEAFKTQKILNLCEVACLQISHTGKKTVSRWPDVTDEYDLKAQIKRMKSTDKYMAYSKLELEQQGKDNE